ncbi:MAG: gliding motility-associated C-terminal domain-containing protein [Bacteroidetes bacterium]|nr:gliding motility-associated C-terminal domain-containing protein [Bacteroidota bacterium]
MKHFATLLFVILLWINSSAQGPGGVINNLTLWLKADNASSLTGNPVQSWTSSGGSASGYSVSQTVVSKQPAVINGATNSSKFNFNPRIKFTSTSASNYNVLSNNSSSPDLLGSNGTAIVVTTNELGTVFTYSAAGRYQLKPNFRFQTGNSGTGYTFDWTAPTEYSTSSAFMPVSYGCAANMSLRKNSLQQNTANNSNLSLYYPAVLPGIFLGANNTVEASNASIAEIILFDAKPSGVEMDRVETYLALKYGITRGGNTGLNNIYNYIASNATTVVWDKTANAGFNFDIAGIGRDDNGSLNQKQSVSVNNGEALTIALGNAAIPSENNTNSALFATDNSFLVWGNNGLAKTFNIASSKPNGIQERLTRVWKTQATNFNQVISMGFETSQITGLGVIGTLCVLADDDGNFSDASVLAACLAINPSGSRVEFSGINLPAGKPYLTLARVIVPTVISNNGPICPGATLVLNAQSITGATYNWTGPNSFASINAVDSIVNALVVAAGGYSVTINNNGCLTTLNTSAAITASQLASVSISQTTGTNPTCAGALVGFTAIAVNGGIAPTFQWKVNGVNVGTGPTFSTTSLAQNDAVTVELSSTALCVATPIVNSSALLMSIQPPVLPAVSIVSNVTSTCSGAPVSFTATAVNAGSTPSFVWKINGISKATAGPTFSSTNLSNADVVTVELVSSEACAAPATVLSNTIQILVTPQPIAAFSYSPLQPNETDPLVSFTNQSLNETSWHWDFDDAGSSSILENPSYTFSGVGNYQVSLIAQNGLCADTLSETITVIPFTAYFIPNSFTPNGDGINEVFGISGTGIDSVDFEMAIYNRWGELVFQSNEYTKKWAGKTTSGYPAPEGIYVYRFRLRLKNKLELIKSNGSLILYR